MGIILEEDTQVKLKYLTASRMSSKSKYVTSIKFLVEGNGSRSGRVVEAFLAYWLFWYGATKWSRECSKPLCDPLAILIERGSSSHSPSGLSMLVWTSVSTMRFNL